MRIFYCHIRMIVFHILLIVASISYLINPLLAQQPNQTPLIFQGQVKPIDNTSDTLQIRVNVYSDKAGSQLLWTNLYKSSALSDHFQFTLRENESGLHFPTDRSTPLWVGIQVDGMVEARPLTQLSASAVAHSLPDGHVTNEKLAEGAVSTSAISFPYLKQVRINGTSITNGSDELRLKTNEGLIESLNPETNEFEISTDLDLLINPSKNPRVAFVGSSGFGNSDGGQPVRNSVGAGENNSAAAGGLGINYNSIMGGESNVASGGFATIVGGSDNTTDQKWSIIGGGSRNEINTNQATELSSIGGGTENIISSNRATIVGGDGLFIEEADVGSIGGGFANTIIAGLIEFPTEYSTIFGGGFNLIQHGFAVIGGGGDDALTLANESLGEFSVVLGGENNRTTSASEHDFIGGGKGNRSDGLRSVVLGGESNSTSYTGSIPSTLLGGFGNSITIEGATILGGKSNSISGPGQFAVIGGGEGNTASGSHSVTYGGQNLIAQSYAQAVIGFNNFAQGTSTPLTQVPDDRLFIVGNGTSPAITSRSNAFEVTNTGHSIVFEVRGDSHGGSNEPDYGGTYIDNTLCAWGDFDGATSTFTSDFGVTFQLAGSSTGNYIFIVQAKDPHTGAPIYPSGATITATIVNEEEEDDDECVFISSSTMGPDGSFFIHTRGVESCEPVHARFCFKVVARLNSTDPDPDM